MKAYRNEKVEGIQREWLVVNGGARSSDNSNKIEVWRNSFKLRARLRKC